MSRSRPSGSGWVASQNCPAGASSATGKAQEAAQSSRPLATVAAIGAVGLIGGSAAGQPLVGGLVGVTLAGTAVAVGGAGRRVGALEPRDTLEDLARGLAEAMVDSDLIERGLGAPAVRVGDPDQQVTTSCYLDGAGDADARRFAEALAELIEPLWDPRCICSRRLRHAPTSLAGADPPAEQGGLPGVAPAGEFVCQTVPGDPDPAPTIRSVRSHLGLAGVGAAADGRVLRVSEPEAQAVLAARTGDGPFGVEI